MPDVFKILKDLELKIVGLDPQTSIMQGGYFISFRSVGLPIHKADFVDPWSPLGGNLEKDIPKSDPSDPKNAPKTGSGKMDENTIFAANIGNSQKAYLNGFLLTDRQLRMNNEYSVMPTVSSVSDAWWAIITGANGIPTQSVPNPDLQKALDAARAKLQDKDGNVTPHYQAYMQYEDVYKSKKRAWNRAYSNVVGDPMKMQNWPIDGVAYEDDTNEAMDRWVGLGFKEEIESALATLAAQGIDPAIALIGRAKKRFINSLNEFQSIGEIPYTIMLPNSWYDPGNDDGWTQYTNEQAHTELHYQASSTSYGGGGGFSVGLWSAAGSFDHMEKQDSLKFQTQDLEISFKYCAVDIMRPWMISSLLNLKNWFLMGDYKKGCISTGDWGQVLPENDPTFLPSVVTSLLLIKDLTIKWGTMNEDLASNSSLTSGSLCVGYGPFIVSGNYSRHGEQSNFETNMQKEGLKSDGIQLLGYVSQINPLSPGVDSSQFLTNPH